MQNKIQTSNVAAIVIGGYVNGYSIIRELSAKEIQNIWLLDQGRCLARYSNRLSGSITIDKDPRSLLDALISLRKKYSYLVLYPTDDLQLENIHQIRKDISEFCFLPFNTENLTESLDKNIQYSQCQKLNLPYPFTVALNTPTDIKHLTKLTYPILIKPNTRKDLTSNVFRSMYIEDVSMLMARTAKITDYLTDGFSFLASEYIPGDDTNIYAYAGYRSKNGHILREWVGKKLTQYPDAFGVFSSASNDAPDIVRKQGRALLTNMNLIGFAQPEFKYDKRDGQFKLMEINLRSMMWHRIGHLSGIDLQHGQWLDAIGEKVPQQTQNQGTKIHYIYMKHEIVNLLSRSKYVKHFLNNIFNGDEHHFAVFDAKDIKPFIYDFTLLIPTIIISWIRFLRKNLGSY